MAEYRLSRRAQRDMDNIADYSLDNFGLDRTRRYRDGLLNAFELIAAHPAIGRDYSHLRRALRRFEHESHSIYYQAFKTGILIVRVLGQAQLAAKHLR